MVKEDSWLKHVMELLDSDDEKHISWAAFRAACETLPTNLPAITTMLPLFYEKVDTPVIKHCMNVLQSVTEYLNPQQVLSWPVIVPFLLKLSISSGCGQIAMVRIKL
jgi:hypothetical protein